MSSSHTQEREVQYVFIDKQDLSVTLEIGLGCKLVFSKLRKAVKTVKINSHYFTKDMLLKIILKVVFK